MKPTMTKAERTGFRISLFLFICFFIHYAISTFLTPKSVDSFDLPVWLDIAIDISWIILYAILLYKIMTGRKWAIILFKTMLLLAMVLTLCFSYYFPEYYQLLSTRSILGFGLCLLIFSYFHFSKSFKDYIKYIRNHRHLILP
ncbi:MAG: hypothetical protein ACJAWV_002333 [Flammeovirgaceae bacterium]|jgi:hypothetical protein